MTRHDALQPPAALRVVQQVAYIKDAFAQTGIALEETPAGNGGVGYICAAGQLLVVDKYLTPVQQLLGQEPAGPDQMDQLLGVERIIDDIVLMHLGEAKPGKYVKVEVGHRPTVEAAVQAVARYLGEGIAAPNHILTAAQVVGPCPATEPEEVYAGIEPYPGVCTQNSGAGILVYIADTGLLQDAVMSLPWMHGVQRALDAHGALQGWDPPPAAPANAAGLDLITPYMGHGTFVAGVVRCIAPEADVIVSNVFNTAGSALESDFVKDLAIALRQGVDVFNLSISGPSWNDRPMLAFSRWLRLLRHYKGVVCVVAAGNSGVRRPSWPAADAGMVAVGALSADWRSRAEFSNHGGWVDVYAPGRNLVNAFTTGYYKCYQNPYVGQQRDFYGMAMWSGTSFSTPIVTGLVADRMSRTGEDGQEAAAALLRIARRNAIPGVGAVLVPCDGTDRCRCPRPPGETCRRRRHDGCDGEDPPA
jgi:subtilisin family serine protease